MCGGAQDPDATAAVFDHRECVHPRAGQGDRLKEVTGQEGVGLGTQEVGPRAGAPVGRRIDAGILEDLPDGRGGHLHSQHEQLAVKAPCSPRCGFSLARRSTRIRMECTVRGRPGRLRGLGRRQVTPVDWAGHRSRVGRPTSPLHHGRILGERAGGSGRRQAARQDHRPLGRRRPSRNR